jgi:molybdopterin-containing oxidoreductase family iron-sulfur binding subunit
MVLTACGPKRLYEVPQHKLKASIAEMERRYKEQLGQDIRVSDQGPLPGVHFAYALDISRCIGCRRCVYACVAENNQSRDPQIHWIRVFSMEKEKGVDFTHANPTTIRPRSPKKATSTFPSVASSARIRPVPRFAPHAPPGPKRTASWSSITTGASAAAIA